MAGHSKWANIKHRKERADAKKGKIFSRVAKEIISAVKQGGADPSMNAKLRFAIQKAKAANFPHENIKKNIKKAMSGDQLDFFEMTYEIYGYGGVGIVVDVMTDNKNRASSEIRIATNKKGGNIASPGSVLFNFDRKGVVQIPKDQGVEEELFNLAVTAGAEDFAVTDDTYIVVTPSASLYEVKERIESGGIAVCEANLEMIPKNFVVCDEGMAQANYALIDYLEKSCDVDAVFHNMK